MHIKKIPESSGTRLRWGIFGLFVALMLCHHCFVFLGFYGMDDINYARLAAKVAFGDRLTTNTRDHFELRWTTIFSTAFFYKIFGVGDYSSRAFSLLTIILSGYFIKKMISGTAKTLTSDRSLGVYTLALMLFFMNYQVLFASHRIWADTGICFLGFGAWYFYLQAWEGKKQAANAITSAVCFFIAMLTKETVLLFIPLILFLFIRDIARKRLVVFWKVAAICSAMLLLGYIGFFRINTGDWLYRYHLLQSNSSDHGASFDKMPFIETIKRTGYTLWQAFLLDGGMLFLVFGFSGFIYRAKLMPDKKHRETSLAFFVLLLSANFMTISFTSYVPLSPDTRHFLFLYPFAAITGAYMLNAYFSQPWKYLLLPVLISTATIIIFAMNGGEMKWIYLLVCIVLFVPLISGSRVFSFRDRIIQNPAILTIALFLCLLIRPMYDFVHTDRGYYDDHKKLIRSEFTGKLNNVIVYSADDFTTELSEYFLGFNTGTVQFRKLLFTDSLPHGNETNIYFLINTLYNPVLTDELKKLLIIDKKRTLVPVSNQGGVILYKVDHLPVLDSLKRYATSRI